MINLNINIKEVFEYSEELFLWVNQDKNIVYKNKKAASFFGNCSSLTEIEHLFSFFDVCILDKEHILNYTPLKEAYTSKIPFRTEILVQIDRDKYKKFNIKSFKTNEDVIIILSDMSSGENEKRITELEKENSEFLKVKERAQNLAIRTSLINRISNSIRESLNIEEIINIITTEVTNTLGLAKGQFFYIDEINEKGDNALKQAITEKKSVVSTVMTNPKINHIQPRLVTPVLYRGEIIGVLIFYHLNNKKAWHEEEINLIEGISSQLASAINQSRAQTQLIQSEKMASLGQLVAGVSHEINTPLGAINSNNDMFLKCLNRISGADEDIISILKELTGINTEAIRRINELVKSLRNFARLDQADFQEADLHEGLKNTLMLINHEIKNRIEIEAAYGEIPPIKCYPNLLNQVFMNILVNAYQSIQNKGKISIKTEKIDEKIIITISDSGQGIPKENLKRIFDPGFTTKSVGVGTGLGLSICYQIIEKHNGKIHVDSQVGKGTTFRIELPV